MLPYLVIRCAMILPALITTALAYVCFWSSLGLNAEGVTYMVSHPMLCIPEDGQVVQALASRIICASWCNQLQGLVFSYVGELLSLLSNC